MSTIRVVNIQHSDATEPNIVLEADGTATFVSGITISGGTNLTVSGTAEFASGTVSAPGITFIDDNNTGIYEPAADTVAITTAATERLRIDSSGRVGIGTSSPNADLHVKGGNFVTLDLETTGGSTNTIRFSRSSGGPITEEGFVGHASSDNSFSLQNQLSGPLLFATNATERMRIDSSGRLLVGTSSSLGDGSPLQVVNDTANPIEVFRGQDSVFGPILLLNKSRGSTASPSAVNENDGTGAIAFKAYDGSSYAIAALIRGFVDGTPGVNDMPGRLVFSTTADGASSSTERMRIDSAGHVGIGTTSPTRKLDISGSGGTSIRIIDTSSYAELSLNGAGTANFIESDDALAYNVGGSERMRILSTGGLTFNGDTAQANALDDYEEGTFSTAAFNGTITYTGGLTGNYTKIGRVVYFSIGYSNGTFSGATGGVAKITGLPFAANSDSINRSAFFIGYSDVTTNGSNGGYVEDGTTNIIFYDSGTRNTSTFSNGSAKFLYLSGFYLV
jgi:hypothetical protein